ncbi:MAG: tripartite tricarboxylate transporter substrate binding protein [Rhodoplanes sp.]|uniref:Bug family tripartite tricarboxylate transporter substrate binding protein n=1 Tax=Rhodoplanes sp. TaxID=1968906 RepID=UPI0017EB5422|nr:tripartite tricarboxylate transporter substrate binding protein [Rhodoplanes sp.]NVO17573.1 tripartite tricarboxylate transporter substrate binding protein [Rhodoplanes sp.]
MRRRSFLIGGGMTLASALARPAVHAQSAWPHGQPIRMVVPFPAGAGVDGMARLAAERLQDKLGATIIVENRPGGAGVVGTTAVMQAKPDGYTLLGSAINHVVLNLVLRGATFDPQKDFECVARTASAPLVMVIAPQRPERTLTEILESAKRAPKEWTFAVPSLTAPAHLAAIDFMRRTGVKFTLAYYRGAAPALTDVLGGHVQLMVDSAFTMVPAALDGRLRAIGVTSRQRSPLAPQIPTMIEAGVPDFVADSWYGIWAPKGTPVDIRQRINDVMREAMADPEIVKKLQGWFLEPVAESIDQTETFIAGEVPRVVALLKSVDFQPQ